jgi:hypothetical protein
MRRSVQVSVLVAMTGFAAVSMAGPKWELSEDSWMKLSFLGQVHGTYTDGAEPETDVFLRRARVIVAGQVMDGVQFFAETDNDNAGKSGAADASTDIQDAFVDVRIMDSAHWVKAGLILLPFSFETRASAASLLGIDYNSEAVKLVNTFVWRDYGAEVHGDCFDQRVSYAVGVFDGYDSTSGSKNPDADARVTGHVAVNLIGKAENGWFYSQSRLNRESDYVSIGAGYDRQDKATLAMVGEEGMQEAVVTDSEAWVVDFQSGFDCGSVDITINGAWYDWDGAVFAGNTAFVESGVMVGKTMVTGKYSLADPDCSTCKIEDYTAGLQYFMKGHNARAGVEYRWGDSADRVLVGLQFLL